MTTNLKKEDVIVYLNGLNAAALVRLLKEVDELTYRVGPGREIQFNTGVDADQIDDDDDEVSEDVQMLIDHYPRHKGFIMDMVCAGFEENLRVYRGRFFYDGPAVVVPDDMVDDVIRATQCKLQQDSMGKSDVVLYPKY